MSSTGWLLCSEKGQPNGVFSTENSDLCHVYSLSLRVFEKLNDSIICMLSTLEKKFSHNVGKGPLVSQGPPGCVPRLAKLLYAFEALRNELSDCYCETINISRPSSILWWSTHVARSISCNMLLSEAVMLRKMLMERRQKIFPFFMIFFPFFGKSCNWCLPGSSIETLINELQGPNPFLVKARTFRL